MRSSYVPVQSAFPQDRYIHDPKHGIMLQRYALLLFLSFGSLLARAEHLPGGTLSARCVGNNFYEITLKLYRACSGTAMIGQELYLDNDCGVSLNLGSSAVILQSVEEVSPLCAADLPNSTCNGGTLVGFELYTYKATVYLSPCNSWRIGWNICCRNVSLNVLGTPGLYLETRVNNFGGFCNAGAEFVDNTVPLVCVGQPVSYDASATDADGHALRYRLIDAQFSVDGFGGGPVAYYPGYSGAEPYPGMEIDSLTGRITFLPTLAGIIVTVVEVNEYDSLGNWIASSMHDFPFYASNCNNSVPSVNSGVFNDANGVAQVVGDRALLVCSEGDLCATLEFNDLDSDQTLTVVSNIATALPGAVINLSGTNPVIAEICWNSTGVAIGTYQFSITVTDDACPVQGFQQFAYTIEVSTGGALAGQDALIEYCLAQTQFDMLPLLGGTPSEGGSWTDPNSMAFGGTFNPGSDLPGEYTYSVGSTSQCPGTAILTLALLPETDPLCLSLSMVDQPSGELQVLPENSVQGRFRVIAPHSGAYLLSVISSDGRVVNEQRVSIMRNAPFQLDLGHLAEGSYVLRLINKNDGTAYTDRVIVR